MVEHLVMVHRAEMEQPPMVQLRIRVEMVDPDSTFTMVLRRNPDIHHQQFLVQAPPTVLEDQFLVAETEPTQETVVVEVTVLATGRV
jgi:hypothetical protein